MSLAKSTRGEQTIESRIISGRHEIGYRGAGVIRRAHLARGGYGIVDLLILPNRGRVKAVLIEVKRDDAADVHGKVVGQLLLYYMAVLRFSRRGVALLSDYARRHPHLAERPSRSTLQQMAGRVKKGADERILHHGQRLQPRQIQLMVGLGKTPSKSLKALLRQLRRRHQLNINVVIARGHNRLQIWPSRRRNP